MNRILAREEAAACSRSARTPMISRSAPAACSRGCRARAREVTMAVVSMPNASSERTRRGAGAAPTILGAELFILNEDKPCRVEDIPMHELVRRDGQLVGDVRPDLVITHSAQRSALGSRPRQSRDRVGAAPHAVRPARVPVEPRDERAGRASIGQCFADITETIDTQGRGDRGAQVAAAEARSRVDARPRARDGPDQRVCSTPRRTKCCGCGSEPTQRIPRMTMPTKSDTHPRPYRRRCRRTLRVGAAAAAAVIDTDVDDLAASRSPFTAMKRRDAAGRSTRRRCSTIRQRTTPSPGMLMKHTDDGPPVSRDARRRVRLFERVRVMQQMRGTCGHPARQAVGAGRALRQRVASITRSVNKWWSSTRTSWSASPC